MRKMFPMMIEKPEAHTIVSGVTYWFFAFLLLPALTTLSMGGTQGEAYAVWVDIGYHVCNFLFALFFFFAYMKDAFLTVQLNTKEVLGTAVSCAVVIVVLKMAIWRLPMLTGNTLFADTAFGSLVTTETDILYFSTGLIAEQPIWGTLCLVILAPVTITCLCYACVFAPICTSRPWLAYLVTTLLLALPRLSMVFCLWPFEQEMSIYLVQLPVHLIACWSYQKTDTVWTPIAVHIFSNFVLALQALQLMGIL